MKSQRAHNYFPNYFFFFILLFQKIFSAAHQYFITSSLAYDVDACPDNNTVVTFLFLIMSGTLVSPEPEHCPGTQSQDAGKADACQGCPNQKICASSVPKVMENQEVKLHE